jgi:adenylate kinase family enzyme
MGIEKDHFMAVKLFVLGCPGSGKSTSAHYIITLARGAGYSAVHINDYEILYEMFKADIKSQRHQFRYALYGGFEVLDLAIYDTALVRLEKEVEEMYSQTDQLIIIEFARADYSKALRLFSDGFLRDAYFLFIDSDQDICIRRIHNRTIHPTTLDDHFVPEHVVKTFRHNDNKQYIASNLKTDYCLTDERVKIIDNTGASMSFFKEVTRFAESIFKQEMCISRETEQLPRISVSTSTDKLDQETRVSQETEPVHIITAVDESTGT